MTATPRPGQRIRLTTRIGFTPALTKGTVVDLPASLLNGYQFAADFGGHVGLMCLNADEVEVIGQ